MKQNVRQRVNIHDRYQVELKVEYQLLPSHSTRDTITTYFFIPQTLGINEITYPPGEFYRRTQNYIRLRTPQFTPQALLTDPTSPLCIIETILREGTWLDDMHTHRRLADQFKFLRAILRRSLDQSLRRQWRKLTKDQPKAGEAMIGLLRDHLTLVEMILTRYRQCGEQFTRHQSDADLWESYQLTDEALSLVVEENLLQAMVATEQQNDLAIQSGMLQEMKDQLVQAIQREVDHRRQHNYQSILSFNGDNEQYLHRVSALKKYTSSVLYLGTALSREGATAEHFLFALAAGISMTFATVVAFSVQAQYGAFTFPVFIALIVGYMFKDRIKELGRSLSLRFLHTHFYDRRIDIYTLQDAQRLGHMREKTFFLKTNELPARIIQARNQGAISMIDNGAQGEQVLCYTRDVTLHTHMFQQLYKDGPPITGVADILRLDVRPFLHKMDDPIALRLGLDGKRVRTVKCAKVYYMNVVSVYTVGDAKEQIVAQRVRLTLHRKGLVRLQTMSN